MKPFDKDPVNIIICGVGGQGNILMSRMIGRILIQKGYKVDIGETFGAAQRGGSVYSSMRISTTRNWGPLIPEGRADLILSLEPLEALRLLLTYGNHNVTTIFNTNSVLPVGVLSKKFDYPEKTLLIQTIQKASKKTWSLNATEIAIKLNTPIVSNIVMIGAMARTNALPITLNDVETEIEKSFPVNKVELNLKALNMGSEAVS